MWEWERVYPFECAGECVGSSGMLVTAWRVESSVFRQVGVSGPVWFLISLMLALEGLNGGFGEVFERDLELASSGVGVVQWTVLSGIGAHMKGDVVQRTQVLR